MTEKSKKPAKQKSVHYVNNKIFSNAVVEYVVSVQLAKKEGKSIPPVSNYIGECFMKICEGLSHKSNFIRYTYRDEMVMDAVENCLRAIGNFNIETATRTGAPNAFSYFTQIAYFAFLRRLSKEKKQHDIKMKFIEQSGIEEFMLYEHGEEEAVNFIDELKERLESIKNS